MDTNDVLVIHDDCGLPVELCVCPDAEVQYDPVTDMFVEREKIENG